VWPFEKGGVFVKARGVFSFLYTSFLNLLILTLFRNLEI